MDGQNGPDDETTGRSHGGLLPWSPVLEGKEDPRYTSEEAMIVAVEVADPDEIKLLEEERKAERVLTLRRPETPSSLNGRRARRA
jgi:hypothetical protein